MHSLTQRKNRFVSVKCPGHVNLKVPYFDLNVAGFVHVISRLALNMAPAVLKRTGVLILAGIRYEITGNYSWVRIQDYKTRKM